MNVTRTVLLGLLPFAALIFFNVKIYLRFLLTRGRYSRNNSNSSQVSARSRSASERVEQKRHNTFIGNLIQGIRWSNRPIRLYQVCLGWTAEWSQMWLISFYRNPEYLFLPLKVKLWQARSGLCKVERKCCRIWFLSSVTVDILSAPLAKKIWLNRKMHGNKFIGIVEHCTFYLQEKCRH